VELQTLNQFLAAAVKNGASDIHFKAGVAPALRINGQLLPVKVPALAPEDTARIAKNLLEHARWRGDLDLLTDHDSSYALEGVGRFRVNVYRNKGHLGAILRSIPFNVPDFDKLGLPPVLQRIAGEDRGLILVTGVTGSGKSSTLAAIVGHINSHARKHILTIEDPIEFLHEDRFSRVTQREIGADTPSFGAALRAALRQDPDVILVGPRPATSCSPPSTRRTACAPSAASSACSRPRRSTACASGSPRRCARPSRSGSCRTRRARAAWWPRRSWSPTSRRWSTSRTRRRPRT
jgi:twitching motility protein PilT